MRGKNADTSGASRGRWLKLGATRDGWGGRRGKLTTAAPAAADGGSAKVASGVEGGFCKNRVR